MICLDYRLSSPWPGQIGAIDLSVASETTLRYDCFLGDVIFVVNGIDFSARWDWVPVLDFALALHAIAAALEDGGRDTFEFTESDASIDFRREGSWTSIEATYSAAGVARLPHTEFEDETARFLLRVVGDFVKADPRLAENELIVDFAESQG